MVVKIQGEDDDVAPQPTGQANRDQGLLMIALITWSSIGSPSLHT